MSSFFQRLTSGSTEYDGGNKMPVSYRNKCNFDQPKKLGRFNKNQLQGARCIKALLVFANIFINIWYISNNVKAMPEKAAWNVFCVTVSFYSLWGSTIAFVAHITSILACNKEGWFRIAYIANEISFAVNSVIMIIFWCLLWPLMSHIGMLDSTATKWYQGLLHFIPWLTTVAELAMTDLALEKSHWKFAFLTMCPFYMCANAWGALNFEYLVKAHENGSVYGVEQWKTNALLTVGMFIIMAFFQSGIYYCLCSIVERCWPKREAEMFDQGVSLIEKGGNNVLKAINN